MPVSRLSPSRGAGFGASSGIDPERMAIAALFPLIHRRPLGRPYLDCRGASWYTHQAPA
jgi:hypothetical protein